MRSSHWRWGGVPSLAREDFPESAIDSFFVGEEGIAEGGLADEADDAGCDVGVGFFTPGGLQVCLGVAGGVEGEEDFAKVGSGELARPLGDDFEGRELVHLLAHELGEAFEVVGGSLRATVAA